MTRLDHDCAMATAKAVLDMVGHLLRDEEQKEFFGMTVEAVKACLLKRDELLRRERKRLAKPSDNRGNHERQDAVRGERTPRDVSGVASRG